MTMDGYDRRTLFGSQVRARATIRRPRRRSGCRPTARAPSSACKAGTIIITVPVAGRETIEVRVQGRGDDSSVPVTRMSTEGGDYLRWTPDSKTVTWAWGAQFFRQDIASTEPQKTDS